jgi:signal transduction histidine kinase
MSRAVSTPAPLSSILSTIAGKAAAVMEARAASILLLGGRGRLRFAGSYGLSAGYREHFAKDQNAMPVAQAYRRERPVVIADTETDPRFSAWREAARGEGYRALIALPLSLGEAPIGALAVYRERPGSWSTDDFDFLALVGAHVASAVRTAQLLDGQRRRLAAHSRAVLGLRQQTRNHVDRLESLSATLAQGDARGAAQLVADVEGEHYEAYTAIAERIHNRVLASLLLGEASIARRRGVAFRLDRRSRLDRLPEHLGEIEAVSVVSNLLENAFDAVAGQPARRRKVVLLIKRDAERTSFRVRDWGSGLQELPDERVLRHGFTTKADHSGVGLALVAQLADAAGGCLQIERPPVGAAFRVVVPNA